MKAVHIHNEGCFGEHTRSPPHKPLLYASSDCQPSSNQGLRGVALGLPRRAHRAAIYSLTTLFIIAIYVTWLMHSRLFDSRSRHMNGPTLENQSNGNEAMVEDVSQTHALHSRWVLGPPTQSFRANLRQDTKYVTSWMDAGWSTSNISLLRHVE